MPIYEYSCNKCGREFEELVFGEDKPACPACGAKETERLMSCACVRGSGSDSGDMYAGGGGGT